MARKKEYTPQQIIDAIKATKGMVYLTAERLRCSHTTVYNYIKRYASVRDAFEHESGRTLDATELKLYQAAMNGEGWAVKYLLATKGKSRGYTERSEVTGADGGPVEVASTVRIYVPDNGRG